nr:UDP-3-O-acyl-N-acetylglucosamine deacetylase [Mangrovibacter yixingensis]
MHYQTAMLKQKTISQHIETTGIGLHSGKKVHMKLSPAPVNTGVVFRRVDLSPVEEIPLRAHRIKDAVLATNLFNENGVRISTIEHLSSAIAGLGIDNLYVELNAAEVPIMDGSSNPFVYLLLQAGIQDQQEAKSFLKITKPVRVTDGDKWAMLEPGTGFSLDFTIEFNHPAIAADTCQFALQLTPERYVAELSRARTFGFIKDIEYLQKQGLSLGASLDNAIGLDEFNVVNPEGLRYPNELVRHKMLDAVGDLYAGGHNLLGHFSAYKSGHALNNALICTLLDTANAWTLITSEEPGLNGQENYSTVPAVTRSSFPSLAFRTHN